MFNCTSFIKSFNNNKLIDSFNINKVTLQYKYIFLPRPLRAYLLFQLLKVFLSLSIFSFYKIKQYKNNNNNIFRGFSKFYENGKVLEKTFCHSEHL